MALNVTVNCSCGDKTVSPDYGLFVTYPLRIGESLESVAAANNLSVDLVRRYNPVQAVDWCLSRLETKTGVFGL